MKTITVQDHTWKMLTIDKLNMGCETIDQVITKYKKIITKINKGGVQDEKSNEMVGLEIEKSNSRLEKQIHDNVKQKESEGSSLELPEPQILEEGD